MPVPDFVLSYTVLGSAVSLFGGPTIHVKKTVAGYDIFDTDGVTLVATCLETTLGLEIYFV